ncbi:MAG: hypothetical protein GC179_11345 [Anaerolineaceae bacterium]|nr:hypothetical protein [Anaerolineaceae bacterium]
MVWLRLVWYVFWRGLIFGAVEGALFGTLIALVYGLIYGVLIGAGLGAVLGLINGLLLAALARWYALNQPDNPNDFLRDIRILTIPFDMIVVLVFSMGFASLFGLIPPFVAAYTIYNLSPGFAEYADSLRKQIPSRNVPANVLS